MDELQLTDNDDPALRSIIRRASIEYIDFDIDNNETDEIDTETNNNTIMQTTDNVQDEKYYSYQLVTEDGISCIVDQHIANISDFIKSASLENPKTLVPSNTTIIMITENWLKTLHIMNYSDIIIQLIIEYYPFCIQINIINEIRGSILKRIVQYMDYYYYNGATYIEKPLKSANMRDIVCEWEANFIEVDQETLFELILAANKLKIKPLLDLTCAKVASMIKGKTPEEIRKRFNIQNDFSPEEEEAVRAENKWAEDS
eukprot:73381_1